MEEAFQLVTLGGELRFEPLRYEHIIPLPTHRWTDIRDILMTIHGNPTKALHFQSVENVHIHLNEHNITPAVLECLKTKIDTGDQDVLKLQYQNALDKWMELVKKLIKERPANEVYNFYSGYTTIDREEKKKDEFVKKVPLSENLDQLGSFPKNPGKKEGNWSGNLHIFNYLYTYIDIPPLSLNEIWEKYLQITPKLPSGTPAHWFKLSEIKFVVSAGPTRLGKEHWDPPGLDVHQPDDPQNEYPTGSVSFLFEMLYHDPLVDEVDRLRDDLKKLRADVEALAVLVVNQLNAILTEVGPQGTIQNRIGQIDGEVSKIITELTKAGTNITNLGTKVTEIEIKVKQLHDILEGP